MRSRVDWRNIAAGCSLDILVHEVRYFNILVPASYVDDTHSSKRRLVLFRLLCCSFVAAVACSVAAVACSVVDCS